jgi:hypothetical protein
MICKRRFFLFFVLFVLVACGPTATAPELSPTIDEEIATTPTLSYVSSDWAMFRYNLNRAGYNPTETDLYPPLVLKWEFKASGKI